MQASAEGRTELYRIEGHEGRWRVAVSDRAGNDKGGMAYTSKEAAFEAAVAAASNAIRAGREVVITVPGVETGESTLGVEDPDWQSMS